MNKKDKLLTWGCALLQGWSGINLLLSGLIVLLVTTGLSNSPLLAMVFSSAEVAAMPLKYITALNTLTILYNSYAVAMSITVWFMVKQALRNQEHWPFWVLLFTIGSVEIFAFVASAPFAQVRWQVNVLLSLLYVGAMLAIGKSYYGKSK